MKTSNIVRGIVVVFAACGAAAVARADERVVVHVPFDFIVAATELPAGDYIVTKDASDAQGLLSIESVDGRNCVFTLSISASAPQPSRTELVFETFENRHFLSKVTTEGGSAREIPLTPKIMGSELAQMRLAPPVVVTPD